MVQCSCICFFLVLKVLLIGPTLLGSLHRSVGGADLGVGGVSYVEMLILCELWAGERLSSESEARASNFSVVCSVWSRH